MIVFDVSTLIGVAIRHDSRLALALRHALQTDQVAVSESVLVKLLDVLHRPRLARFIDPDLRTALLSQLTELGVRFVPTIPVTDCRDPKDDNTWSWRLRLMRRRSSAATVTCSCWIPGAACGS